MAHLPLRSASSLAVLALGACLLGAGGIGCDAILGIHDVEADPTGGGGAGGTPTGGAGGAGGAGGSTSPSGGGGTGGSTSSAGDFTFGLKTAKVILPLGGLAFVDLEIVPENGFEGPVDVTLEITPNGVTFTPVTLPAGTTVGQTTIGAGGVLAIGDKVPLTFVAKSGAIEHEVAVMATVTGEPGALVESFGAAGVASWFGALDGTNVFDVREVAQNKIVVTGDNIPGLSSFLKGARVLPTGAMDTAFGPNGDGTVTAQFCGCSKPSEGRAVLREIGGRVLMIGTGNAGSGFIDDVAVAIYEDDGTFDNMGGNQGKELIDLGGKDYGGAAALANDGGVVIAASSDDQLVVAKLNDFWNGLDSGFGMAGKSQFPPGKAGLPRDIAVDPASGDILALSRFASTAGGVTHLNIVLVRLGPNGAPTSFGGSGYVEVMGNPALDPRAVAVDSQGRIVVASTTTEGMAVDVHVLRFLPGGALDTTFGKDGVSVLARPGADNVADMVLLADDRIVVTGMASQPFLARLLTDGTPDPTFGMGGFVSLALGSQAQVQSMALSADGEIFLAGFRESQPSKGFVAKVWQ